MAQLFNKERWVPVEDDFVREHYRHKPVIEIAARLKRSVHAVRMRAQTLRIAQSQLGRPILPRPPIPSLAQLRVGVCVISLATGNEFVIRGKPRGEGPETRILAQIRRCGTSPRVKGLHTWLAPVSVALVSEYEKCYGKLHG